MRNIIITATLIFFIATTAAALVWFIQMTVERDEWQAKINDFNTRDLAQKDADGEPLKALGLTARQEGEVDYYSGKKKEGLVLKVGIIEHTDKYKTDLEQQIKSKQEELIKDADQSEKDLDAAHKAKLEFHNFETDDHASSAPWKVVEIFMANNKDAIEKEKVIVGHLADQRRDIAAEEQRRLDAHLKYITTKVDVESEKIKYRAMAHEKAAVHKEWGYRYEQVKQKVNSIKAPPYTIQGRVVRVGADDTRYVSIDRGSYNHVQRGMRFTVFRYDRAGQIHEMGKIVVREVRDQSSDCLILPYEVALPHCQQCGWVAPDPLFRYCIFCFQKANPTDAVMNAETLVERKKEVVVARPDPFRPLMAGDHIWNRDYDQRSKLRFFIGSRPPFRSTDEITKFITENGGEVVKELDSAVDYFVPGTDKESDDLAKKARQWGVPIMTVREVFLWFGKDQPR
jgi:hypothetical protein